MYLCKKTKDMTINYLTYPSFLRLRIVVLTLSLFSFLLSFGYDKASNRDLKETRTIAISGENPDCEEYLITFLYVGSNQWTMIVIDDDNNTIATLNVTPGYRVDTTTFNFNVKNSENHNSTSDSGSVCINDVISFCFPTSTLHPKYAEDHADEKYFVITLLPEQLLMLINSDGPRCLSYLESSSWKQVSLKQLKNLLKPYFRKL